MKPYILGKMVCDPFSFRNPVFDDGHIWLNARDGVFAVCSEKRLEERVRIGGGKSFHILDAREHQKISRFRTHADDLHEFDLMREFIDGSGIHGVFRRKGFSVGRGHEF